MASIDLIAAERQEQLIKHHRSIQADVLQNTDNQLILAAQELLYVTTLNAGMSLPKNWDANIWAKMVEKPYFERRIIAAALIAADLDREQYIKNQQANAAN